MYIYVINSVWLPHGLPIHSVLFLGFLLEGLILQLLVKVAENLFP